MTYTTAIHALPAPDQLAAGIGPDVPKDVKALADALDTKLTPFSQGAGDPAALALAAGKVGRRHRDTTTGHEWLDIGAAWVDTTPSVDPAAGVGGLRTLGAGALQAAPGNDARLSDTRVPTDGSVTAVKVNAALKPSGGAAAATEALRALGVAAGTAAAGNDARLTDQRVPTDDSVTAAKINAALKGGPAAGVEALRALGVTATTAAAGNDARLTDSRAPNGAAGGVLNGVYPNPGFAVDMATQAELDAAALSIVGMQQLLFRGGYPITEFIVAGSVTTMHQGGSGPAAGGEFVSVVYLDAAEHAYGATTPKLRLRLFLSVNAITPNSNFTASLRPVTWPTAASGATNALTPGAAVAGSSVSINTPAAGAVVTAVTADFAFPGTGQYMLVVVNSAQLPAGGRCNVGVNLITRNS